MVRERKEGWTTLSVPIRVKKRLENYIVGKETWEDLLLRLLQEVDDYRVFKERYKLK